MYLRFVNIFCNAKEPYDKSPWRKIDVFFMLCPRISEREEIQRFHVHTARVRICIAHTHVSCRRRSIIYYYYFCSSLIVRRWISLVPVKHSLTARGHVLGIHLHTQKTAGRATISTTTTAVAVAGGGGGRRGETFLHVLPRVRTMIIYKRTPIQVHGDDKSGAAAAERGGDFATGIRKITRVLPPPPISGTVWWILSLDRIIMTMWWRRSSRALYVRFLCGVWLLRLLSSVICCEFDNEDPPTSVSRTAAVSSHGVGRLCARITLLYHYVISRGSN